MVRAEVSATKSPGLPETAVMPGVPGIPEISGVAGVAVAAPEARCASCVTSELGGVCWFGEPCAGGGTLVGAPAATGTLGAN